MGAGRYTNPAAIEQNTATQDAIGGEVKSWSAYCATWPCELVGVSGGEIFRGRQVHASAEYVALGHHVEGVTPRMRMTLLGRTFDILRALNVDTRGRELRLELKERGL
jgi:head-tail adaptor